MRSNSKKSQKTLTLQFQTISFVTIKRFYNG